MEISLLDANTSDINNVTAQEQNEFNLFSMLKPSLQRDGNQWCVLYGEDLQVGIAGFGDNPHQAIMNFNMEWYKNISDEKPKGKSLADEYLDENFPSIKVKSPENTDKFSDATKWLATK